jgi:putative tryptophan/tyrosine transport system substrate-binding protein
VAARGARAAKAARVVGFLSFGSPEASAHLVAAFRKGLGEIGFVEGQNITIEFRWAQNPEFMVPAIQAILSVIVITPRLLLPSPGVP